MTDAASNLTAQKAAEDKRGEETPQFVQSKHEGYHWSGEAPMFLYAVWYLAFLYIPVLFLPLFYAGFLMLALVAPPILYLHDLHDKWQSKTPFSVREELLQLPAVSHVDLWHAKPYQIDVELSEEALRKYGLTHADVTDAMESAMPLPC